MSSETQVKTDVFTIITIRIIDLLEKGIIPWRQPWKSAGPPRNLITMRPYRGFNTILLSSLGYANNIFLTLKQINDLGGRVKKGEHSCPVVYWSQKEEEKESGEKTVKRLLRYYSVFNVEQCIGIPEDRIPQESFNVNDSIQACEAVIEGMPDKPKIRTKGDAAFYAPLKDTITMPAIKYFDDSETYYVTLFHELIHSTGHEKRLKREAIMDPDKFGSEQYSEEELVAQIGACFLASHTGCSMKHFGNDVAYIDGWLKRLRSDKRFILFASAKAQRAVDYILRRESQDTSADTPLSAEGVLTEE